MNLFVQAQELWDKMPMKQKCIVQGKANNKASLYVYNVIMRVFIDPYVYWIGSRVVLEPIWYHA